MVSSQAELGTPATQPVTFADSFLWLRSAQKSSKGAPPYSLYINRPLGRVFAAGAYRLGMTPDQVTAVSAAFSFAGIAILAAGPLSWGTGVAVSLLLALGYALDSADGQLARLRGGGSLSGEWLDHMIDSFKNSALHVAVLITALRHEVFPGGTWWLAVPMVFLVVTNSHFFGMILVELLHRERRAVLRLAAPAKTVAGGMRSLVKAPTDYGVLCWVFVLVGAPMVFGVAYAVLAAATAGYLLLILRKWRREVGELDRMGAG